MNNPLIHSIFFSPTGATRSVVRSIGKGISSQKPIELDLTIQAPPPDRSVFSSDDLMIIGMPVYSGRLPSIAKERFQSLEGNSTSAVVVVVYGNRAYDDALVELFDLCKAQGFTPVSAGTFIGQHSFSSHEVPLALHRPNTRDLQAAKQLGRQTQLRRNKNPSFPPPPVPGTRPYKPKNPPVGAATATDPKTCIQCGACIAHCPTQSIRLENEILKTNPDTCIWCMACTKHCPSGARTIISPKIGEIAQRLHTTCPTQREPELFFS